jgi:hypothetical protein
MFIETGNQPVPGLRRSPMFDAPHRAPLERLVFLVTGYRHLAALRPGAQGHYSSVHMDVMSQQGRFKIEDICFGI